MMRTTTLVVALGFGSLLIAGRLAGGQVSAPVAYADENSKDPAPLKLSGVEGNVRGLGGDAISRATVALFTEQGHTLVASMMTDKDGKFRFTKVDKGLYRVVARVDGLCTANIPINVGTSLLNRRLEITMQPKDIDTCSYGMAKK